MICSTLFSDTEEQDCLLEHADSDQKGQGKGNQIRWQRSYCDNRQTNIWTEDRVKYFNQVKLGNQIVFTDTHLRSLFKKLPVSRESVSFVLGYYTIIYLLITREKMFFAEFISWERITTKSRFLLEERLIDIEIYLKDVLKWRTTQIYSIIQDYKRVGELKSLTEVSIIYIYNIILLITYTII